MILSSRFVRLAAAFASLTVVACGSDLLEGKSCTDVGCNNGLTIDFVYREAGTYAVDVTVDGVTTTCTATLPLTSGPGDAGDPCAVKGIYLTRTGSALSPDAQSIGGLRLTSTTVQSLAIRVTRDGKLVGEGSFTPQYVVSPGPNGPDCEPKECRAATYSLSSTSTP